MPVLSTFLYFTENKVTLVVTISYTMNYANLINVSLFHRNEETLIPAFLSNNIASSLPTSIGGIIFLAIVLFFYGWIALRASKKSVLKPSSFTLADVFAASILGCWLISVIAASFGKDQLITLPIIMANCLLYFCIVVGILGFLSLRRLSPISIFGLAPPHPGKIIKITFLWFLSCYPLIIISQGVVQVLFSTSNDAQSIVRYFLEHPGWHERVAIISMAVIVAPIAEELIFRGYFYGILRRFAGRVPAILISSLLFAAIHLHLPSMLGLGLLAIILCLLYERTGSLWANILMHATFNALSIVMLLLFQGAAL